MNVPSVVIIQSSGHTAGNSISYNIPYQTVVSCREFMLQAVLNAFGAFYFTFINLE